MAVDAPFTLDLSQWPIAVWRVHRRMEMADVESLVASLSEVLKRGEPYVQVIVASALRGESGLPSGAKRTQADWARRNHAELARLCRGMAMVNDMSPVLHFAASFVVSLMGRMPSPWKMFSSEADALAWARSQLGSAHRVAV